MTIAEAKESGLEMKGWWAARWMPGNLYKGTCLAGKRYFEVRAQYYANAATEELVAEDKSSWKMCKLSASMC